MNQALIGSVLMLAIAMSLGCAEHEPNQRLEDNTPRITSVSPMGQERVGLCTLTRGESEVHGLRLSVDVSSLTRDLVVHLWLERVDDGHYWLADRWDEGELGQPYDEWAITVSKIDEHRFRYAMEAQPFVVPGWPRDSEMMFRAEVEDFVSDQADIAEVPFTAVVTADCSPCVRCE